MALTYGSPEVPAGCDASGTAGLSGPAVLLSAAFCPPIEYFAVLARYSVVYLEACENYQKQSWRNRCRILGAGGPLDLSFPICHTHGNSPSEDRRASTVTGKTAAGWQPGRVNRSGTVSLCPAPPPARPAVPPIMAHRVAPLYGGVTPSGQLITETKIDYSVPWVGKMERAVYSAYDSSPFFEFYRDEFFAILDSRPATLWNLDLQIIRWMCRKIGIAVELRPTESFLSYPVMENSSVRAESVPPRAFCPACYERPLSVAGLRDTSVSKRTSNAFLQNVPDFREAIHPKRRNTILRDLGLERPYWQVFGQKFGFVKGLSALDLLFNEGPDSILYLK